MNYVISNAIGAYNYSPVQQIVVNVECDIVSENCPKNIDFRWTIERSAVVNCLWASVLLIATRRSLDLLAFSGAERYDPGLKPREFFPLLLSARNNHLISLPLTGEGGRSGDGEGGGDARKLIELKCHRQNESALRYVGFFFFLLLH